MKSQEVHVLTNLPDFGKIKISMYVILFLKSMGNLYSTTVPRKKLDMCFPVYYVL